MLTGGGTDAISLLSNDRIDNRDVNVWLPPVGDSAGHLNIDFQSPPAKFYTLKLIVPTQHVAMLDVETRELPSILNCSITIDRHQTRTKKFNGDKFTIKAFYSIYFECQMQPLQSDEELKEEERVKEEIACLYDCKFNLHKSYFISDASVLAFYFSIFCCFKSPTLYDAMNGLKSNDLSPRNMTFKIQLFV